MQAIHCVSVQMTRIVLPGMEARKRGVIVNLSSAAYELLPPLLTVYSATKVRVKKRLCMYNQPAGLCQYIIVAR